VKRLFIILVLGDNFITRLIKNIFPTRWVITGKCKRCGNCCRAIYLTMTPAQTRSRLFTTLSVRWISWLFDFILLKIDRENNSLVFTCRHLTPAGSCANYRWRPNVCRNYPLLDYFEQPKFLPGCGFTAKLR
jgi:Fe-S-cluster containining protein